MMVAVIRIGAVWVWTEYANAQGLTGRGWLRFASLEDCCSELGLSLEQLVHAEDWMWS